MKYNYSGKVVLVTGSSSGIGEGIARELASFGASLVITGRSRVNVARVASDCYRLSKVKVREKSWIKSWWLSLLSPIAAGGGG